MVAKHLRALVVDDEPQIRKLVVIALRQQGIECDVASDGVEAAQLASESEYDAVVTDLRMPKRHGHDLITSLLKEPNPPIIVAHTGVIEPRLARDLLQRGVDDILFKPTDFGFLAAKVRLLIDRRNLQTPSAQVQLKAPDEQDYSALEEDVSRPVSLSRLNHKLSDITSVLPISSTALDVFTMTRNCDSKLSQIAAVIQRDASLAAEVLRLANSAPYNPTGQRIIELDSSIARIGQKRVGELALTSSALAALAPEALPWLDLDLTWKRSMAAGIALEALVEIGGHEPIEGGLVLSAIMYPLGRVALGMAFPNHYKAMVAECDRTGESLEEQERRIFPTSHTEVMAHLLATWKVPPDVFQPLKFSLDEFSSLVRLSEPARTRTELVKLAIVLGRLAAGSWQTWDCVQLPNQALLKRLRISNVVQILSQTKADLAILAGFRPGGAAAPKPLPSAGKSITANYCDLAEVEDDLFVELLPSMGIKPKPLSAEALGEAEEPSIVNCLAAASSRFVARRGKGRTVVVTDQDRSDIVDRFAATVVLPSSYGRLRDVLLETAGDGNRIASDRIDAEVLSAH